MTIYCEVNNAAKHDSYLFSTYITRFPGGNMETLQQLHQVNRHPRKSRNGAFQNTSNFQCLFSFLISPGFFIIVFIHFICERISLKFLLRQKWTAATAIAVSIAVCSDKDRCWTCLTILFKGSYSLRRSLCLGFYYFLWPPKCKLFQAQLLN
jgi:hypothetical protein